jgi:hypothetical protein
MKEDILQAQKEMEEKAKRERILQSLQMKEQSELTQKEKDVLRLLRAKKEEEEQRQQKLNKELTESKRKEEIMEEKKNIQMTMDKKLHLFEAQKAIIFQQNQTKQVGFDLVVFFFPFMCVYVFCFYFLSYRLIL